MYRYDRVKFVDTSIRGIAPVIAYFLKETGKLAVLNPNIGWFSSQFSDKLTEVAAWRTKAPFHNFGNDREDTDVRPGRTTR